MAGATAVHDRSRDSSPETTGQAKTGARHPAASGLHALGNQEVQSLFVQGAIQAKLAISQPADPDEQEADRVAEQVMRMEEPGSISSAPGRVQRKCAACEAVGAICPKCEEEEEKIQRKEKPGHTALASRVMSGGASCTCASGGTPCPACRAKAATRVLRKARTGAPEGREVPNLSLGGGRPLSHGERSIFEPRMGNDLGDVRVHTDPTAARAADAIGARAFARGNSIAFARGEYSPQTSEGRLLMAHELAHVVQQRGRAPRVQRQPAEKPRVNWTPGMRARLLRDYEDRRVKLKRGQVVELTSDEHLMGSVSYVQAMPPLPFARDALIEVDVRELELAEGPAATTQPAAESTLRRSPDLRKISISPEWVRGLTDSELSIQETILQTYLSGQTAPETTSPDYLTAQQNLQALQDEQRNRVARPGGFNVQAPQMVPRPAGLPLDDGYTLQELPGVPSDVAAQIPEGEIVTLSQDELEGKPPAADRPSTLLPGLGGGSWAGLRGADAGLMRFGLAPAGDFAIGLVAIPPAQPNPFGRYFNLTALENPFGVAGHTELYVRQGNQITIVRGFKPKMRFGEPSTIWEVMTNYKKIFSGKKAVPGDITSSTGMFRSTSVRTVEYPVTPEVAAEFAGKLPPLGTPGPGEPPLYTAPPSNYARQSNTPVGCEGTNCGLWGTQKVEGPLGSRISVAGQEPIVDIPDTGRAAQGKLYEMMDPKSNAPLVEMPGATGSGVRGGVSPRLRVLKWGGRVFAVAGGVKLGYDIVTAPEGERAHVAFVGGSSFVGGFAAGAALGLVCGPGAPVCSVVTGLIGGIAGALGAGELAEAAWNFPENFKQAATTATEIYQELQERKVQELVRKSGGTMPPAVQDVARASGPAIFFAD